jgi:hypothetical protein
MPELPPPQERIDVDVLSARESVFIREHEVFLLPPTEEGNETDAITLLAESVADLTIGDLVSHIRNLEKRVARISGVETREVTTPAES